MNSKSINPFEWLEQMNTFKSDSDRLIERKEQFTVSGITVHSSYYSEITTYVDKSVTKKVKVREIRAISKRCVKKTTVK